MRHRKHLSLPNLAAWPDVGLVNFEDGAVRAMYQSANATLKKHKNSLSMRVATTLEQLVHAYAIRAICFMEEGTPANVAFDANDLQSTHFVVYDGEEPIGALRVRWFRDFAKLERSAFREKYRDPRTLRFAAEFVFEHIARKGYTTVITHARPVYARLWQKMLGFQQAVGKPPLQLAGENEVYIELFKTLEAPTNAISTATDAITLARPEGDWDRVGIFERQR